MNIKNVPAAGRTVVSDLVDRTSQQPGRRLARVTDRGGREDEHGIAAVALGDALQPPQDGGHV